MPDLAARTHVRSVSEHARLPGSGGGQEAGPAANGNGQLALTSPLATSPLMTDPAFLLLVVGTAIRAGFAHELTRWQLRPLQYQILVILSCVGGLSQHELCQGLGITKGHLAGLIDGLRALGCVSRTRDGSGRRRYIVAITPRGLDTLAQARGAIEEYTGTFLAPLADLQASRLTAALRDLYATAVLESPGVGDTDQP
jgi:MarR family transcriptional regulator, lower aerobic nicotinate degradation pathway regulator